MTLYLRAYPSFIEHFLIGDIFMNATLSKTLAASLIVLLAACGKTTPGTDTKADAKPAKTAAAPAADADTGAQKVIRFGTDATYPPFESTAANGDIIGFDIDIAKAMCAEMQAKCTFTNQDWDGIIPALIAKKYDVIASSMSVTPARQKAVLFTQMIWGTPSLFVAPTNTDITDNSAAALKGIDIGVQQGTVQDDYLTKYYGESNIKRYKTVEDAIADLGTGRLKVVFADGGVVTHLVDGTSDKGYKIAGEPVPNAVDAEIFGAGTAFAVRPEDTALADELNKAFDAVRASGKYDEIAAKYFKFNVYPKQ